MPTRDAPELRLFYRVGELADIFSGEDFEILIDEEGKLPTRGSSVPAKFFACRKRPGARSLL